MLAICWSRFEPGISAWVDDPSFTTPESLWVWVEVLILHDTAKDVGVELPFH